MIFFITTRVKETMTESYVVNDVGVEVNTNFEAKDLVKQFKDFRAIVNDRLASIAPFAFFTLIVVVTYATRSEVSLFETLCFIVSGVVVSQPLRSVFGTRFTLLANVYLVIACLLMFMCNSFLVSMGFLLQMNVLCMLLLTIAMFINVTKLNIGVSFKQSPKSKEKTESDKQETSLEKEYSKTGSADKSFKLTMNKGERKPDTVLVKGSTSTFDTEDEEPENDETKPSEYIAVLDDDKKPASGDTSDSDNDTSEEVFSDN